MKLTGAERNALKLDFGFPLRVKGENIEVKKGESWTVIYTVEEGKKIAQTIISNNKTYKAGTKRGEGIAFERLDNKEIQEQKEELGSIIKSRIDEIGSSLRKLESSTNVHSPQIHGITSGNKNYTIENFLRVLNALDLEITISQKQKK
ncbi:hypothetical protein M5X00_26380 [Paenibacillus alvei]|uniref:hypothetical protein n=1 Tax=Paenibacillus alvei TaxID=44250 RepID=UPI00227F5F7D|nr:hypothetical protein [Paenibacillus alvei]MCY9757760.1 hypothetical protein [Paenibacillus alvei]